MLPAVNRLSSPADFARAMRGGRRVFGQLVVLHWVQTDSGQPPRVGLAVSKSVGNAVTRHQVARRLRHVVRDRLVGMAYGGLLVIRALPPAAAASSSDLAVALDAGLARLLPSDVKR